VSTSLPYALCVSAGVLSGVALTRRLSARAPRLGVGSGPTQQHRMLRGAALAGAVVGAIAFEWPADRWGWTVEAHFAPVWGGRTVLGGVAGGWLALEFAKRALGVHTSVGVTFTAPLALEFAVGRLGCFFAGCCQGRLINEGPGRWPATLIEAAFDLMCAVFFSLRSTEQRLGPRLFPAFIAAWCAARFSLEFLRDNPQVAGPFTYYQVLAAALCAAAVVELVRRRHAV
jgi:phosphatidylglycerol---prolipoprotein diacylglyceryl transferase